MHSVSDKMNVTMMCRGLQLQRLLDKEEYIEMVGHEHEKGHDDHRGSVAQIYLSDAVYDALLEFVRQTDPTAQNKDTFPVPNGAKLLMGCATSVQSVMSGDNVRVTVMNPNNCILWRDNVDKIQYGLIQQIYCFADHLRVKQLVIMITEILDQYPKRHNLPTTRFRYLLYLYKCVVGRINTQKKLFVNPRNVISLAAYRFLPSNTLGIPNNGIILTPQDRKPFLDISTS
jgi:hypothetical protein